MTRVAAGKGFQESRGAAAGPMRPAPPDQVEGKERNTPAITVLRIEGPLGFELIDRFEPKRREKN